MRILIYGAGIQGSYLAHSLMKGDNQVTLLARGKRKEELLSDGVVLYHRLQRKLTKDNIRVIEKLRPEDKYDLIFVTMKYSDFPAIIEPLAKNCSQTILFIGNQLNAAGLEKELQKRSTQQKVIYFGFQMTGGIKTDKGISILRFGKGQLKVGSLTADFKIANRLDTAFNGTNYAWRYEAKMDDWLKSHATMIMVQNSFEYLYDFSAAAIRRNG
ncbi:MAG: ketopantoate reductase family protein, partial [Enterococcus hulanensis]